MRRLLFLGFLAVSTIAVQALAQSSPTGSGPPPDPTETSTSTPPSNAGREAAAQALFDEAVKLMEARRYPAASQKLDPAAGTLLDLGTCYEKNRQTASAWATFVEAAAVAEKGGHPDWAARARERVAALEPLLARVTVVVPPDSTAEGLVVERDSLRVDAGSYGSAIPVDPGQYTFTASAPGKRRGWSTTVTVEAGGHATVTIPELENEPPPPLSPPVAALARPPFWSPGRVAGATVGVAGVVGLVVGSILGVQAKSDYDEARTSDCPGGGTRCTPAGIALGQSATSLATGSTVSFIVAGVALGTGISLLALGGPHHAASAQQGWLRAAPLVGLRSGGVGLEGAW
jgi:hypothetical protein